MTDPRRPCVWLVDVTDEAFQRLADTDLPTEADRQRADSMADPARGRILLARRAALRVLLGRQADRAPGDVKVVVAPGGKPVYVPNGGQNTTPLAFSVAHTGDLFAVAVGGAKSLGLDVEQLRTVPRAEAIATRWFGAAEAGRLNGLSREQADSEFMRLWTAKEALAKRHGAGLRLMKGDVGELDIQVAMDENRLRYFKTAVGYAAALASSEVIEDIQVLRPGEHEWTI
jgi:4'-phosphopantetheinyl transferase